MAAQTQPLRDKIADLDRQIEELQRKIGEAMVSRRHLQEVLAVMTGGEAPSEERRQRVGNVKGVVLDALERAKATGLTSAEALAAAQAELPQVQRDTVSSLLSRLKKEGTLAYDGNRYYVAAYAPTEGNQRPFDLHVRAAA